MTSKLLPNLVVRPVDLPIPPTCLAALRRQSRLGHFRCWHKCEVPRRPLYRRYRGKSGSGSDIVKLTRLTLNGLSCSGSLRRSSPPRQEFHFMVTERGADTPRSAGYATIYRCFRGDI